jgi:hypothetical protein
MTPVGGSPQWPSEGGAAATGFQFRLALSCPSSWTPDRDSDPGLRMTGKMPVLLQLRTKESSFFPLVLIQSPLTIELVQVVPYL